MAKTADYTKRAVDNYRNKFDMYQLRIPKDSGLKERMKDAYGKDMNNVIIRLIEEDLERKANNTVEITEKRPETSYTDDNIYAYKPRIIDQKAARRELGDEEFERRLKNAREMAAQLGIDYDREYLGIEK